VTNNYDKVRRFDSDGYRRAVEIGSLIACHINKDTFDHMILAAKVEQAIMELLANRIDFGMDEK
jgi:hypothetical protein